MAVIPMSYSPATVARRFSILDGVTIQGVLYQIIWDPKTPFAAVIEAAPSVIGYTDLMVDGAPLPHQPDTIIRWLIDRPRS